MSIPVEKIILIIHAIELKTTHWVYSIPPNHRQSAKKIKHSVDLTTTFEQIKSESRL
jgi:hypothetical protein